MRQGRIVMIGTAFETRGGISAVVNAYRNHGLFARWPIQYLPTHCDGGAMAKLHTALAALLRFAAWLIAGRVALVHVHAASRASFWRKSPFMLLAFITRRPVLFHLHGGGFRDFYQVECGPLARCWIRMVLRHSARVLVLSPGWQAWVHSTVPAACVMVVPNPAPQVRQDPVSYSSEGQTILFLGALLERKGVFDLLEAVRGLRPRFPAMRLVLAGTGEDRPRLEQTIRAAALDDCVELPGWVDEAARNALLRSATVFVLPSYFEGLPMSMLEAMSAGVPVIATAVGGIPEVIENGVDGMLIAPGDIAALKDWLATLLDSSDVRSSLACAARAKVQSQFGVERCVGAVERVYSEMLGVESAEGQTKICA